MGVKIVTLIRDTTREMILCPDGVNTVGCMWVNNQESQFGGTENSYTAWLEANGFNQLYKFDLEVTYGLMGKINIVHVQIGITTSIGWNFKQIKITDDFHHRRVAMGIYLKQPNGFEN